MRTERSVKVKVTTVPEGKIQLITRTEGEVFHEVFVNKNAALKDRENMQLLYGIHTMVFAFGSIGGVIAALDMIVESIIEKGPHFEKLGAGALALTFSALSVKIAERNREKMKILKKQIYEIERS